MTAPGSESRHAVVLFTKPAQPGRVKTRLVGALSRQDAASLHAAFVRDTSSALALGDFDLVVAWALDGGLSEQQELLPAGTPSLVQAGAGLGERLYAALAEIADRGYRAVAAVGSDHPGLSVERMTEAFARLEHADVVWGPVPDGGYDLVALRSEAVGLRLFEGIAWSTTRVLEQSLERARELVLEVELLEPGFDVDTPEDLEELILRLAEPRFQARCPRTTEVLEELGLLSPQEAP